MALRLEGEERADLEQRVERLEVTLRAAVEETGGLSVQGPCGNCGQCLLFRRRGTVYCPHCGDGRNL